ncbi:MAG: UDP-2,3-diacylglucosamine diphosphatase [Candidatus Kapabacteria bacterium]|nr:UDP-2,3-diacylglucosamine diphosphatase [Candidatus Kapabacteria bacterium]
MYYFISDVHLGHLERKDDKQIENLLLQLLSKIKSNCETLYIVGDLFDYWFEYNTVIPSYYYRTLTALSELCESGIKIEYIMGNHDFGHIRFFDEELGIKIYKTDIERTINNKKFYISHGDGKAYNDKGYLLLRAVLRNPFAIKIFKMIQPDFGISLARGSSHKSRKHTDSKVYGENDGMTDFAKKKLEEGFDYVVMGHRHKVIELKHSNGEYFNLGEWINNPTFGSFDGETFKILKVKEFLID